MKTIGIIGGVGWSSTMEYYKRLNEKIHKLYGDLNCAKILMHSINFQDIIDYQRKPDFDSELNMLKDIAVNLEKAGADILIITSNTTSKTFDEIKKSINIPIVNVIDVTIQNILEDKIEKVGVLGTQSVMYTGFYRNKFKDANIQPSFPPKEMGVKLNDIIYNELVHNIIKEESVQFIKEVIKYLSQEEQVEAVVLGCTELPLSIKEENLFNVKIYDSIEIHIEEILKQITP